MKASKLRNLKCSVSRHSYLIKSYILYNDMSDHFPIFNLYEVAWYNDGKNRENGA